VKAKVRAGGSSLSHAMRTLGVRVAKTGIRAGIGTGARLEQGTTTTQGAGTKTNG
jgi:hypothetical protein